MFYRIYYNIQRSNLTLIKHYHCFSVRTDVAGFQFQVDLAHIQIFYSAWRKVYNKRSFKGGNIAIIHLDMYNMYN